MHLRISLSPQHHTSNQSPLNIDRRERLENYLGHRFSTRVFSFKRLSLPHPLCGRAHVRACKWSSATHDQRRRPASFPPLYRGSCAHLPAAAATAEREREQRTYRASICRCYCDIHLSAKEREKGVQFFDESESAAFVRSHARA